MQRLSVTRWTRGIDLTPSLATLGLPPLRRRRGGGEALHGVYWHDNFGYYWSHGCVNLTVSDAKWLWDNWVRMNTRVYVYDEKPG